MGGRFAPCIPLLRDFIALWRGLEAELGADLDLSLDGGVMVATTEAQLRSVERKAAIEGRHGPPVEMLDRSALRAMAGYVAEDAVDGSSPRARARRIARGRAAFARRAARLGAAIRPRTDVLD